VACVTDGLACNPNTFKDGAKFGGGQVDYFMAGNYLAVGVTSSGTLGTYANCDNNYCPAGLTKPLGLQQDKNGWGQGAATTTGDFFLTEQVGATRMNSEFPQKEPFEWCIAYRMSTSQDNQTWDYLCNDRHTGNQMTGIQVEQESSGSSKMLGLRFKWVEAGIIQVDVRYSFHTCSKLMKIEAKITNLSTATMQAPAFMIMVNANKNRDPPGAAAGTGTYNTVDTIRGQSTLGDTYSSVCSSGADDPGAAGLSLCLSSMSANSYAYRGLEETNRAVNPKTGAAAIFTNPRGEGRPGVGLEGITGFNTTAPQDKYIALVTYGPNLLQNQQTGDLGMFLGAGILSDVEAPIEQRCQ